MKFEHLLPDTIFETVEAQGFRPTGVISPLNSYENRVYEIGLEEADPIIAKYYRPGRWSAKAIAEEHQFLKILAEAEVPVVTSFELKRHIAESRHLDRLQEPGSGSDIYYAFFPKFRGRAHDEITNDDRLWLGRTLARLHNIGEHFLAPSRLSLNPKTYGYDNLPIILGQEHLPDDLKSRVEAMLQNALALVDPYFQKETKAFPVHGDCHPANILWNNVGPHLLDFDDLAVAPPVQDLWMLFYGDEQEREGQRRVFFEGYETFRKFDQATLILSEPLRTLRMIRHVAWIGQRYEEEAFQRAFPFYAERRFWEEFLQGIKEQISLLQELSWR